MNQNDREIRVITKLPNTEQSSKGKGKTHKSTNRQNQSTTGKLRKLQWPWLGTGISKRNGGLNQILWRQSLPLPLRLKGSGCHYNIIFNNTGTKIGIIVVNTVLYENPSFIIVSAETEYFSTRSWYRNINFSRDRIRRICL